MRRFLKLLSVAAVLYGVAAAHAADVPIAGLKLVVVDKTASGGTAKAVFVAKDPNVTKGSGTDAAQIGATLDITYAGTHGAFTMPQGGSWLANSDSVAKYSNKDAPATGAVKIGVIKPGSLVKVVAKSLGDTALSIVSDPAGPVYVTETVTNGGETTRMCTQFLDCAHKTIAGGTGAKLVCKGNSSGDAACRAACSPGAPGCGWSDGDLTTYVQADWGDPNGGEDGPSARPAAARSSRRPHTARRRGPAWSTARARARAWAERTTE